MTQSNDYSHPATKVPPKLSSELINTSQIKYSNITDIIAINRNKPAFRKKDATKH